MLNFIKGSIFSRNTVLRRRLRNLKGCSGAGRMGSPSSGKTTVSVKLANIWQTKSAM